MKVTCQRDSLQMACQLVSAAVPATTTIPALKNFKATAQDDALQLVAYDPTQGVGIRYTLHGITVARAGRAGVGLTIASAAPGGSGRRVRPGP